MELILWSLAVLMIVMSALVGYVFLKAHSGAISIETAGNLENFNYIGFHSYKPPEGNIPLRGKLVAEAAVGLAKKYRCPLVLSVGYTVPGDKRMESEIYAQYIWKRFGLGLQIITARDKTVRDADGETRSFYEFCRQHGANRVGVIGAWPHLGSRIIRYWNRLNMDKGLEVIFIGVVIPWRYYIWEVAMLIADICFPPTSKRRDALFNFIGRKG